MTSNRNDMLYISDILESLEKIEAFTIDMDRDSFKTDEKTQYAVIRALEIMGEAASKVSNELKEQSDPIPWKEMSAMRNILIHEYFGVDVEVVWKTITIDLPYLKETLQRYYPDEIK